MSNNCGKKRSTQPVDEDRAVSARDNSDIAARALENADIAVQVVDLDRGLGGFVTDQIHDVLGFGKGLPRAEPTAGGCKRSARYAAETKLAT